MLWFVTDRYSPVTAVVLTPKYHSLWVSGIAGAGGVYFHPCKPFLVLSPVSLSKHCSYYPAALSGVCLRRDPTDTPSVREHLDHRLWALHSTATLQVCVARPVSQMRKQAQRNQSDLQLPFENTCFMHLLQSCLPSATRSLLSAAQLNVHWRMRLTLVFAAMVTLPCASPCSVSFHCHDSLAREEQWYPFHRQKIRTSLGD